MLDRASAAFATGSLGGQVAVTAFTIPDRVQADAASKTVTVTFTLPSGLASTDQVVINTASMVANSAATVTNNQAAGFFGTAPLSVTPSGTGVITLTVAAGQTAVAPGGSVSVTLTATLGVATAGSNAIVVSTFRAGNTVVLDRASAAFATGSLGGRVTAVSVTFPTAVADRAPGATGKTATVSFTIATPLVNGNVITITYPNNYLNTATGMNAVTNLGFTAATATQVTITASGAVAAAAFQIVLTGVTIPGQSSSYFGPSSALCNGI